jgi:hypothetical protein
MTDAVREERRNTAEEETASKETKRGTYEKITQEKNIRIAKYASENGMDAVIRHFKTKPRFSLTLTLGKSPQNSRKPWLTIMSLLFEYLQTVQIG